MKRIDSIDFTRGLVMVIMALDHVRDFMHTSSLIQDPTNLQTTTAALFFTRLPMLFIQGFGFREFPFGVFKNGRPAAGSGVELPVIYLIWFCVILSLYPVCKWYGNYKAAHKDRKLLRYL
jgi:hypothetical protein